VNTKKTNLNSGVAREMIKVKRKVSMQKLYKHRHTV